MNEILIDIYKSNDAFSGLGQFSGNFAQELMLHAPEDLNITLLAHENYEPGQTNKFGIIRENFQRRYFPGLNKPYSIWHSLQQFPSHLPGRKSTWILTVHDLNFLVEKNEFKKKRYLEKLKRNVERADYITTISSYTKTVLEENIRMSGKNIRTIYNGIADYSLHQQEKPEFMNDQPFFFSVGIFSEKKNFHALLGMMKHVENTHLIIAGNCKTPYGERIKKQIDESGLSGKVILPGTISENEKAWLYAHCDAFVFPSLAEGFGMPVIEAMHFGKPVFLSRSTSLPEIGGEAAFYFDNFGEEEMASRIREKLSLYTADTKGMLERLRSQAKKFSWQKCIFGYIDLYREILATKK